jgi:2,3-diketo-5-methylthio-1-phosphopentane phosphatase
LRTIEVTSNAWRFILLLSAFSSKTMTPIIVLDFDGTLTEIDVGRALCERYADPDWTTHIKRWIGGETSFPEAQKRVWSTVTLGRDDLLAHALSIGHLRSGADQLFESARRGQVELVLASGGFDLYIEPLLGVRLGFLRDRFYNHLSFTDQGICALFPHTALACKSCGVCKAKVIGLYNDPNQRVLFCGDGSSDRCAASTTAELFAVTGSDFEKHCSIHGVKHAPFDDFRTVLAAAFQ